MKIHINRIVYDTYSVRLVYAAKTGGSGGGVRQPDWNGEREKLKEQLLPYIREAVKKQFKEEREYYKTRPSLAAKQLEGIFGAGQVENAILPRVTEQVYEQLEERMRREMVRKGR